MPVSTKIKKEEKDNNKVTTRATQEQMEKVVKDLIKKEKKGFDRGEKIPYFKETAKKYNVSQSAVKNTYYNKVQGLVKNDVDERNEKKAKFTLISNENLGKTEKEKEEEEQKEQDVEEKPLSENSQSETVSEKEPLKSEINVGVKTDDKKANEKQTKDQSAIVELDNEGRPLKPPYKYGDIIEVRVDNITDFGAFCYTLDEYEYKGLLHISEIKNIFVQDINEYLEKDEIIKVKVILANPNRLQLSTRELKLQPKTKKEDANSMRMPTIKSNPPVNVLGEKFKDLKDKIQTVPASQEVKNQAMQEVDQIFEDNEAELDQDQMEALIEEAYNEEQPVEQEQTTIRAFDKIKELNISNEKEYLDIQAYLNNKLGALSPKAQVELLNLLQMNGVFKSSIAISKIAENFEVDYGLIFLEQVKKHLKGECL